MKQFLKQFLLCFIFVPLVTTATKDPDALEKTTLRKSRGESKEVFAQLIALRDLVDKEGIENPRKSPPNKHRDQVDREDIENPRKSPPNKHKEPKRLEDTIGFARRK